MVSIKKNVYKYLLPNLLETQRISYCWFLELGFIQELENFSAIRDYLDELELNLSAKFYKIRHPKYSLAEAKRRDTTYSVRIYTLVQLVYLNNLTQTTENEVLLCDIPLMTNEGTFLVNGIERIIINQIVRSPGIYYKTDTDKQNYRFYTASLISNRGTWVKFEIDKDDYIHVKIDKAKKISAYIFLKAVGLTDQDIFDHLKHPEYFQKTFKEYESISLEDTFLEVHNKLRPGEPATFKAGQQILYSRFFDPKRYDLGRVGRYKINKRLNLDIEKNIHILTAKDVLYIVDELINFRLAPTVEDDIDHLGNRRIRSVGELLQNQIRIGLNRLERIAQERMTICEQKYLRVNVLVNPKPLVSSIREFFGSNPLSQFMDQTNPLAELTHKRRLSVLGPGGITRDRAGFAVRDIHPSQYGRICPIETPEGPNAGLIGSLSTYGRVNSYGFIETPFYKVEEGKVLQDSFPLYLDATVEDKYRLAAGDLEIGPDSVIKNHNVPVRYRQELVRVLATEVDFIAVSPIQVVSLATALIPFLEHDDANRALMGSNMQRQAVSLLTPERAFVGTGLEARVPYDSGSVARIRESGYVLYADAERIDILTQPRPFVAKSTNVPTVHPAYKRETIWLKTYQRSNQDTCMHQRPSVFPNTWVHSGKCLADNSSTVAGELALGKNILVAYMPWEGYNFEDAVLVSERLIFDDLFTSVHIERYDISTSRTREGQEYITSKVDKNMHLDAFGVVEVGTWVEPGDVLVGKVSPQQESENTPEGRLLRAIFGGAARDVKDTPLTVPSGVTGRILQAMPLFETVKYNEQVDCFEAVGSVNVFLVQKRKVQVGDKIAGRHGNKGIISNILPRQDMPFLQNGAPVDMVLNPLGVPSRMNVGQIFECLLGLAAHTLEQNYKVLPFDEMHGDEVSRGFVYQQLYKARCATNQKWIFRPESPGKSIVFDGRTGYSFDQPVTVGYPYILKLVHLVDDKIHARSTGPYSLVTQQPLGGRSKHGGQRLGEMEVWALEGFGAAYTLQELLTVKSDDMRGRNLAFMSIIRGNLLPKPGVPESFKVLVCELRGLCLDISLSCIPSM